MAVAFAITKAAPELVSAYRCVKAMDCCRATRFRVLTVQWNHRL